MQYVKLGRSGLKVSRIALGCAWFGDPAWESWALPEAECRPIAARLEQQMPYSPTISGAGANRQNSCPYVRR